VSALEQARFTGIGRKNEFGGIHLWFESLSGQLTQLLSKLNCCGIRISTRALVPVPQHRTQRWQEEMLNHLVDPRRVRPFHQPKQIVCGYQSTNLPQFIGVIGKRRKVAVVTIL
jgi:hypothetical protein